MISLFSAELDEPKIGISGKGLTRNRSYKEFSIEPLQSRTNHGELIG